MISGATAQICDLSQAQPGDFKSTYPLLGVTRADMSDLAQVDRQFQEVETHMGGLNILINNIGISGATAAVEDVSVADWQATLAVNLNSHFYFVRKAVPLLKTAKGGFIIGIASTAGLMGYPMRIPYAASKWALIGLVKTLAMELGEFNSRVTAVSPVSVEGPRMDRNIAAEAKACNIAQDAVREGYQRQASLRTFMRAWDIANMVLFLCC